jgi:hypothetical protein
MFQPGTRRRSGRCAGTRRRYGGAYEAITCRDEGAA